MATTLEDLVTHTAKLVVEHPDDLKVELRTEGETDTYLVTVNQDDFGQIIGRQGRTAKALRALVRAAGARNGRRSGLEIVE